MERDLHFMDETPLSIHRLAENWSPGGLSGTRADESFHECPWPWSSGAIHGADARSSWATPLPSAHKQLGSKSGGLQNTPQCAPYSHPMPRLSHHHFLPEQQQ